MTELNEIAPPLLRDMLKLIPEFNGDTKMLAFFLRKCEYVIRQFQGVAQRNEYIMQSITSRVAGRAAALISERGDFESYDDFKTLLIQHFGDHRSEECVAIELESLKIKSNESYLDFCSRIQDVRAILISKINTNVTNSNEVKHAKAIIHNNTALNVFLYNLPEHLVRIVRLKSPTSLEEALKTVMDEVNFHEQYLMRSRLLHNQAPKPPMLDPKPQALQAIMQPPNSNFRPPYFEARPNAIQPMLARPLVSQNQSGYKPPAPQQQFGYRPPAQQPLGFRPQPGQFGYKPAVQQQFGYKHPAQQQMGYRPPVQHQFGFRPQPGQFGYRAPQPQGYRPPQPFPSDVTMRTAAQPVPRLPINEIVTEKCGTADDPYEYEYSDNNYQEEQNYILFYADPTRDCQQPVMEGQEPAQEYDDIREETNLENFRVEVTQIPEVIELNYDAALKVPYIKIAEVDGKFMLDSGSSRCFISPTKADMYYAQYKRYEPFQVTSTHASSSHTEVVDIPLFKAFSQDMYHKFFIYDVDPKYDGVIGWDLLVKLKAKIDLNDKTLKTQHANIPIWNDQEYLFNLKARTETRVEPHVDLEKCDTILKCLQFYSKIRMPTALVKCENYYATTVIQNTSDADITIKITKPFKVQKLTDENNICEINTADLTDIEVDQILTQNLSKLRLNHLTPEEQKAILELCTEYRDILYSEELPLTFTNQVKHHIRTTSDNPIYIKPYRQAPAQAEEIRNQVEKLLKDNVIQESHSPWSAPVHLVPKKSDASGQVKYRMVIDYRRLNEITTDDRFPLPNICDLFDKLGKSNYFTTLDLASGYHQIEIAEEDRQKTAFSTQNGHYEFLRMPFGLKTAPATFQRAMNNVLRGLQGIHCLVYLDDILIYSNGLREHLEKLRAIFDRLRLTNLKVQLDKSEFLCKEVQYLGHTLTKDGLRPNNDKIQVVLDYPIPETQTEIKRFLGFIGYYRRFIKDFSKITQPLTACLRKGKTVEKTEKYIEAFQKCKELLVNAPILQYPDMSKPFILTTDASEVALGAVLSQGTIGSDLPIAYASRTLSETERRYSAIERELLAIIWATKHFRPYLYGRKFDIVTDHKPLLWLYQLKEPGSKLTRWRLRLQEYDFNIKHKNGQLNANADALSRLRLNALTTAEDNDNRSMIVNPEEQDHSDTISVSDSERTATDSPVTISDTDTIDQILRKEPDLLVPSDTSSSATETIHSGKDLESLGIPILEEAVDTKPNQILVFHKFTNDLQVTDISTKHQKILEVFLPHGKPDLICEFLKKYIRPKIKYFIYFETTQHRREFSNVVITLFKQGSINFYECTERVINVENEAEQKLIIQKLHEGKTCHRGITETVKRIKRNYYWPDMLDTVSAVINACDKCRTTKYDRKPIKPVLQLTDTQDAPFQEVFMDIFSIESKHYLTIVDAFSKLGQALEVPSRSTPEVVRALIKYFSFYGIPRKVSCDPGSEFNNELLRELTDLYKIKLHITTPNNPNSVGIVERFHSTIIEIYRIAKYEVKYTDATNRMTYAIMAYNNTIHSATDLTPFEIVFGHTELNSIFDVEFDKAYKQQLLKDHRKRTQELYRHIATKMKSKKETVREKRGGEKGPQFKEGQALYAKAVNKRQSKDKPKYQKAIVCGEVERNVLPIKVRDRETKVPVKNVKRPPQVAPPPGGGDMDDPNPRVPEPRPTTSRNK